MRLTREERREQTRRDLLSAAREVFLERGFHGASLDEISAAAGYTKGAVQSNFESKDELFLAVYDEYSARRVRRFVDDVLEARTFEDGVRSAAALAWQGAREEPRWIPVLTEFWTHASHREPTRRAMSERHERAMDALAGLMQEHAARHGLAFTIPAREIARGSSALVRGLELERTLDPDFGDARHFEEIWTAFVTGLARPREEQP
jgi:AcrR family transcriptional regulator